MEHHGNITLGQQFGGIAWFSLACGCNDNKEDNSCSGGREPVTFPLTERLNRGLMATSGDRRDRREEIQIALEHRASFFCYEKLGELLRSVQMLFLFGVDIICYILAFFAFRRLIIIF